MTDTTHQQRVLNALEAHRSIGAQRQQKMDVLRQLSAAGDPERDIRSQLDALDKAEADAMDKWAAAGAKGDAPALDHAAREALVRQLAESQAQSVAAEKAAQKVRGRSRSSTSKATRHSHCTRSSRWLT